MGGLLVQKNQGKSKRFRLCVVFFFSIYNPMFSEMTFLLTESLFLVEGNEASGPAGPTGEESFDCEGRV